MAIRLTCAQIGKKEENRREIPPWKTSCRAQWNSQCPESPLLQPPPPERRETMDICHPESL